MIAHKLPITSSLVFFHHDPCNSVKGRNLDEAQLLRNHRCAAQSTCEWMTLMKGYKYTTKTLQAKSEVRSC